MNNYETYFAEHVAGRFAEVKEYPEDHQHIEKHFIHMQQFGVTLNENVRVLDIGTRDAWSCVHLQEQYGIQKSIGIEVLQHYVDYWRKRGRKIVQGDACVLQFFSNGFDVILCRHVMGLVENPRKALIEMWRVLKPDGVAYIVLGIPGNKRLHYKYIKTKKDVCAWIPPEAFEELFFDKNPYRSAEYCWILRKKM